MEATVVVKPVRAHFLLEGSEQQRESSSRALYSSLREHGYALLDFSTGVTADASYLPPTIGGCIEPVKKFFAKSEGEKGCYVEKLVEDRLKGYFPHNQKGPSGKGRPEHYILWLKEEEDSSKALPLEPDFAATAQPALAHVAAQSRIILKSLGEAVNREDREQFGRLLDPLPVPPGACCSSSASFKLKVLNYSTAAGGGASSMPEHVDRGMLTLVVQQASGLEVFDQWHKRWERPPPNSCVLLVGHTLEVASGGVFKATKHRVSLSPPPPPPPPPPSPSPSSFLAEAAPVVANRVSLVFQIQARSDAVVSQDNVPPHLRRRTRATVRNKGPVKVEVVLGRFAASHPSVTGHAHRTIEEDQKGSDKIKKATERAVGRASASSSRRWKFRWTWGFFSCGSDESDRFRRTRTRTRTNRQPSAAVFGASAL
jgi:hypothetical protein